MNRSIRMALAVPLVALAVPAAALATHHGHRDRGHHGHIQTGSTGATGNTVGSYSDGVLVLDLSAGGSISGAVTDRTRFECPRFDSQGGRGNGRHFNSRLQAADVGNTGDTGTTGNTGTTGTTGNTGNTGDTGTTGNTGDTGTTGGTATNGSTSSTGSSGDHGYPGRGRHFTPPTGNTGSTGSTGSSGGHGYPGSGRHFTPPPPCDSSLLKPNAPVAQADIIVTAHGVFFAGLELLPAVQ